MRRRPFKTEETMVRENLNNIERRIQDACKRSGRERSSVRLISVTKTKPLELLREAYDCGEKYFGENKVQEIINKAPCLPGDIHWHMIGHLQKNKVKYLMGVAEMIHGVDSLELAKMIDKEAAKAGIIMPILLEVNVAQEESKFGLHCDEVLPLVREIALLPHVKLKGLMTIAPYTEDPESNRPYFKRLYQLSIDISSKKIDNVDMYELSMGMTGDFEVAIEEGATMIRVGTGIFGERDYNN